MSTLEMGRGQGNWGANLALWALYFAFTPVRLAFHVEDNARLLTDTLRRMVGQIKADRALFLIVLRDLTQRGAAYDAMLDRVFPPGEERS